MILHRANNSENAIKINVNENEQGNTDYQIDRYVNEIFGTKNGDFFVHNSRIVQNFSKTRTFKVLLIEDKDQVKHSVFFELVKGNNENKTTPKNFGSQSRYV